MNVAFTLEGAPSKLLRLGGVSPIFREAISGDPLLIRVSPLQTGDVNLLHLEHRIHDSPGLLPVFIGQQLE